MAANPSSSPALLVDGLRPPALDQLGLVGAIVNQAERLGTTDGAVGGPQITVEAEPEPLPELPAAIEVAAYRIAIEAITNAVRHAGARTCAVRLTAAQRLIVEVIDDGQGVDGSGRPGGTGLESMRERADEVGGQLSLAAGQPRGTVVRVELPLGWSAP